VVAVLGVGSSWRQRSRAGGAGSDDVLEPLSQHSRAGGAGSGDVLEPLSQHSRAGGAGSDDVLEPLSLQMFAVRYRARIVLTVQCLVLTPALARKRSSSHEKSDLSLIVSRLRRL
jgi:hypothetical protein